MNNDSPLVSICIPTKDRADVLVHNIISIINNRAFDPKIIEIVVSDNASTDNTFSMMTELVKKYPFILYNRNKENLGKGAAANFLKVLSLAHGDFLKLQNDYSIFTDGGLKFLVDTVRKYKETKPTLYFDQSGYTPAYREMPGINEVLRDQKWSMSWMGSNGYWKEDFDKLEDKEVSFGSLFTQLDWQIRTSKFHDKWILCKYPLTWRKQTIAKQGGYNFIDVHTTKFLAMFNPYVVTGEITLQTISEVEKSLVYNMVEWIIRLKYVNKSRYSYTSDDAYEILRRNFGHNDWFEDELKKSKLKAFKNVVYTDIVFPVIHPIIHPILNYLRILFKKKNFFL